MSVFDQILEINDYKSTGLRNLNTCFFALYLKKLFDQEKRSILIVTPNLYEANKIYNSFLDVNNSLLFQTDDVITEEAIAISPELKLERINTLKEISNNNKKIVVTDINGYLKKIPAKTDFRNQIINIKEKDLIKQDTLIEKLFDIGYQKETIVTSTGEMGIRGFVLDVFPIDYENPIRIEFFGDEITSIRSFDPVTQKSLNKLEQIKIYPVNEVINESSSNLFDYLENPIVIYKDYESIKISYERLQEDITLYAKDKEKKYIYDLDEIKVNDYICYLDFDSTCSINLKKVIDFNAKNIDSFNEDFERINKYLTKAIEIGKTVIICLSTINATKFSNELNVSYVLTDESNIFLNKVNIINKNLSSGFEFGNYIFMSEKELLNSNRISRKIKKVNFKFSSKIKDITKLQVGDYVVHNLHGIGIYNGIKTIEKQGLKNDYLEVLYDKGDKLYIPASKIELISKYSGKEGYVPKINALNSVAWAKTKQRVKEKIRYEAERLLKVQAERSLRKGFAFSKDTPMQEMFENEFQYEMTSDQIAVTKEVKKDMESKTPMDRILCGDVGYGKTEVAFRAMFKAVMDSKQVLYLCPTTLLSKQQYENAKERFKNFPVTIGLLNRFTSPKQVAEITKNLKEGKIDILFGTHRLLSNDVITKDLGLLVIDEEQRFGVAHKEKIKEFKANVDVLTITATPIPRTLQMAILGLKSLSLIETPPKNRHSVQTYVIPEDKKIIRDIIYKEISRDGQVFILYNKVADIVDKVREIQMLVPDCNIVYAHGQMPKTELEDRIQDFIDKKYNCLVCTTIIETGIDIPNANSLIIYDADRFGLSQLYQIRGRVGRSDRIAYAYLMYAKNKQLNDIAMKRLMAIKEFTELGSGFNIAARDLSIRGAGDILGAEQAGFIDAVGIDLYMKMLENEIRKLKGLEQSYEEEEENKDVIAVSNHIKDNYVKEEDLKIEIHKLINNIKTSEDLEKTKKEIEDRFGKIDNDMYIYMNEELFNNLIKSKGIIEVKENNMYIELIFKKEVSEQLNYEELFMNSIKISNNFKFEYKNNLLYLKIMKKDLKEHPIIYLNKLLEIM